MNYRIVHPGGVVRDIHSIGHPVFSPCGDLIQYTGTVIDITERKRADEECRGADQERERLHQLEADLAHINRVSTLGEMAASLAHETKQPIGAAITSANTRIEWLAHEPPNLDRARVAAARIDKYGNLSEATHPSTYQRAQMMCGPGSVRNSNPDDADVLTHRQGEEKQRTCRRYRQA